MFLVSTPVNAIRVFTPSPTPLQICLPTTAPWIQVTSPNGGEIFPVGPIPVTWTSCNVPANTHINIRLNHLNNGDTLDPFVSLNTGSASYPLSDLMYTNAGLHPGNYFNINIRATLSSGFVMADNSDSTFTINAPVIATPSITVTSPNGGEIYTTGQQIEVTWTSQNIPENDNNIRLVIKNMSTNQRYYLIGSNDTNSSTINDGKEVVTLSNQIPAGQYKLEVSRLGSFVDSYDVVDSSNNPFTINALTSNCVINSFTSTPSSINSGSSSILSWTTTGCNRAKLTLGNQGSSPVIDVPFTNGTYNTGPLTNNMTYGLKVANLIVGCDWIYGNSSVSGQSCNTSLTATGVTVNVSNTPNNFPVGCTSNSGFNSATGIACAGGENLISYWSGKVNQHISTVAGTQGSWITDSDGVSGANLDKLTYCKKWWPNTTSVVEFGNQTLTEWRNAGNVGGPFTSTKMAYQCVQPVTPSCTSTTNPWIKVTSPNGGETFTAGQQIPVTWKSCNIPNNNIVNIFLQPLPDGSDGYTEKVGTQNDGYETIILPSSTTGWPNMTSGKIYKIGLQLAHTTSTSGGNYIGYSTVFSDDTFTINAAGSNNLPAGCASSLGFSPTTGQSCGCNGGVIYSTYNGQLCPTNFPVGCTSNVGFSTVTGLSCSTGAKTTTTIPSLVAPNPSAQALLVASPNAAFNRTLKVGVKGEDVIELQKILIAKGLLTGNADGSFGPKTEQAVIKYQQASGLNADGKAGVKTLAKIKI